MSPKDWIFIAPGAADRLRASGLDTVESALRCRGGRYAALSSTSETLEVFPPTSQEGVSSVHLKRYRYPKRSHAIKSAFRGTLFGKSRARFEYDRLTVLRGRGVPTVEPLAVGERRRGGFVTASILITQSVPGQSLLSFARSPGSTTPADRRAIIETLARQVRRMHDAGLVHGSLVWRDILIHADEDGRFILTFLDPGHVRRFSLPGCRRFGFFRDVADLGATAMLLCTRADRLRFAKAYRGWKKPSQQDLRWLRAVTRRAESRVAREQHRMEVNDMFVAPS